MAADVTEETAVAVVVTVAEVEVEADAGRGAQGREVSVRPREPDPAVPSSCDVPGQYRPHASEEKTRKRAFPGSLRDQGWGRGSQM